MINLKRKMIELLEENGGFSLYDNMTSPKKGYAVAIKGYNHIDEMLNDTLEPNCVRGGWKDTQENKDYFDKSLIVNDIKEAIRIGKERKELAIFDIANMEEIRI